MNKFYVEKKGDLYYFHSGKNLKTHTNETLMCLLKLFFRDNFFPKYASIRNIVVPFSSFGETIIFADNDNSITFLNTEMSNRDTYQYINNSNYTMIGVVDNEAERIVKLEGNFEKRTEAVIMINSENDLNRDHLRSTFNCYGFHMNILYDVQPVVRCFENRLHANRAIDAEAETADNILYVKSGDQKEILVKDFEKCTCGADNLLQTTLINSAEKLYFSPKKTGTKAFAFDYLTKTIRKSDKHILNAEIKTEENILNIKCEYYNFEQAEKIKMNVEDTMQKLALKSGAGKIDFRIEYICFK